MGERFSRSLKKGDFVALIGIFGAGKTYFTKGVAKGLGYKTIECVTSPSFTLCNIYKGKRGMRLYHFDAQRLGNPEELFRLGLQEAADGIGIIEWGDKILHHLKNTPIIKVAFKVIGKNKRVISFSKRAPSSPYGASDDLSD